MIFHPYVSVCALTHAVIICFMHDILNACVPVCTPEYMASFMCYTSEQGFELLSFILNT